MRAAYVGDGGGVRGGSSGWGPWPLSGLTSTRGTATWSHRAELSQDRRQSRERLHPQPIDAQPEARQRPRTEHAVGRWLQPRKAAVRAEHVEVGTPRIRFDDPVLPNAPHLVLGELRTA